MGMKHQRIKVVSPGNSQTLGAAATDIQWSTTDASSPEIDAETFQLRSVVFKVEITAGAEFSAFRVLAKVHPSDAKWIVLAATAADFGGDSPYVLECNTYDSSDVQQDTDITTLGSTEYAVLVLALPSLAKLKFEATGDATTVITSYLAGQSDDVHLGESNDVLLGDVGVVDSSNTVIDPSAAQKEDTAFVAADYVTPAGAVRADSRAIPGTPEDGDWAALQTTAVGELRVRDDDANTDLDTIAGDTTSMDTTLGTVRQQQLLTSTTCPAPATSAAAWDNAGGTGYLDLGASTIKIHVSVDEDTYLVCNNTGSQYAANNPAYYKGGQTHIIDCVGQRYLHHKQVSAAATVSVTPFIIAS